MALMDDDIKVPIMIGETFIHFDQPEALVSVFLMNLFAELYGNKLTRFCLGLFYCRKRLNVFVKK